MNMSAKIEALTEIPANEQCIGHFQLAVQDILREQAANTSKLERQLLELVKINIGSYVPPKGLTTENTAEEFERLLRLEKELEANCKRT